MRFGRDSKAYDMVKQIELKGQYVPSIFMMGEYLIVDGKSEANNVISILDKNLDVV